MFTDAVNSCWHLLYWSCLSSLHWCWCIGQCFSWQSWASSAFVEHPEASFQDLTKLHSCQVRSGSFQDEHWKVSLCQTSLTAYCEVFQSRASNQRAPQGSACYPTRFPCVSMLFSLRRLRGPWVCAHSHRRQRQASRHSVSSDSQSQADPLSRSISLATPQSQGPKLSVRRSWMHWGASEFPRVRLPTSYPLLFRLFSSVGCFILDKLL